MPTRLKLLVTATALIITYSALQAAHAQSRLTGGSSWINERGSILTITTIGANGLLSGTYVTNVGCSAGQPQAMTGWYYGTDTGGAITFSVAWQGCNTVTTWSGQVDSQTSRFQTLWFLTAAGAPTWNGMNAGTDTFTPQHTSPK